MRRLALALAVALAVLGWPDAAGSSATMEGMTTEVSIGFSDFAPGQSDVVAGDTVRWTNDSVRAHTVNADDDSFGSERLTSGEAFSQRYDAPGSYPYHCRLHPFMRGEIDAYDVLLNHPPAPGAPGRPFPLTGRASLPGARRIQIEADTGSGFQPAATATTRQDGTFTAQVTPTGTAQYRALAGGQPSPPVQLLVLDHAVSATPLRRPGGFVVLAAVAPAWPGAPVVLQLRLPERFGWWPVARARLTRDSSVRLFVRLHRRVPARVVLTLPDGATPLAISRTVALGPTARRRHKR